MELAIHGRLPGVVARLSRRIGDKRDWMLLTATLVELHRLGVLVERPAIPAGRG